MSSKETKTDSQVNFKYIVIGGGIAGVTCAETLSNLCPDDVILLLSASPLIKAVTNFRKLTKTLEEFDVEEKPMYSFGQAYPNIIVKHKVISSLSSNKKQVTSEDGCVFQYEKLCICAGATPKVIAKDNPYVLGIRDTETVKVFQKKLRNSRRIIVVGNGGIATELVYEMEGCDVIWAVKDASITSTFIDAGAAQFCLPSLQLEQRTAEKSQKKRTKYKIQDDVASSSSAAAEQEAMGSALGPDWHEGLELKGNQKETHHIHVEYNVEVADILTPDQFKASGLTTDEPFASEIEGCTHSGLWPVYMKLTNGKTYGCDFIVSATGVTPNIQPFLTDNKFSVSEDDGLNVNDQMLTSVSDVYAAGDVCTANWDLSQYWIQMRLWSQARQMGAYAAQCMAAHMAGETITLDFCFEMFAHVTKFFNYKVVLLGKFSGQGLGQDKELLLRVTKGEEYLKIVLKDGRVHGALLIGETDMEETFENLILNQMDVSAFGEDLLNPNIDIEDYFD